MPNWNIGITALVLSFLCATVYFQHEHNHELSRELAAAHHALDAADEQLKVNRIAQQHAAELDKKYTEQLANAQNEINKLRSDVISGRRKLRIQARCVPSNTTSRSMGTDSIVELSRETGSTVLDIRSGIVSDQTKLKYLQDYVTHINEKTMR